MYPIRFEPIYQTYVWGGDKIKRHFKRETNLPKIAESWEISDREEGMSVVMNGAFKGKSLQALVKEMGEDLLGEGRAFERFPILAKIIDAEANLSVQVHPDHFTAEKLKGEPKSEMWVMLEPGAVFAGIQSGVDAKKFQKALEQKKPEKVLEKFDLILGETAHIPGGRVHAICAGALIYEVQQNSNTTFRLYDWERGRDLHLKEGMQAIQWDEKRPVVATPKKISSDLHHQLVILLETEFFIAERIDVFDMLHIGAIPKTFQIFYCLKGEGIIAVEGHQEPFKPGMTYLIPAVSKSIEITGKCEALRVRLP